MSCKTNVVNGIDKIIDAVRQFRSSNSITCNKYTIV